MARGGGMGRGLVVRAVSAHWLDNGEIFSLPVAYIKASFSFICTYIDLRGFLERLKTICSSRSGEKGISTFERHCRDLINGGISPKKSRITLQKL